MRRLNVTHGDSRDEKDRKRFFPFSPQEHLIPSNDSDGNLTVMFDIPGSGRKDWFYELYTKWPEVLII